MNIISLKEAKSQGLTTYFTGKSCPHGHIAPRWISSRACTECVSNKTKKWREDNIEHRREYSKNWNAANPDKVKQHRRNSYPKQKEWRDNDRKNNPLRYMIYAARHRAKQNNIPFDITIDDLVIPDVCPVLGIPLKLSKNNQSDNSPTIDRIIPERGYVKENVIIVSAKANRIKNDATLDELKLVLEYYASVLDSPSL